MREILFRGKRLDNGEWIKGFFWKDIWGDGGSCYIFFDGEDYQVVPDTVGQYTGLTDKNGLNKVFEYDIIDATGRKVGNYYENRDLLERGTCLLVERMGTKEWVCSEQEAIKRGCKYAE